MEAGDATATEESGGRKIKLVSKPKTTRPVRPDECYQLRAAGLYRDTYHAANPKPGQVAMLSSGLLRSYRESVAAGIRRGAIRLVDARDELAVLDAALDELGRYGPGEVRVMISEEQFKIREPRKPNSKQKRKRKKKR